MVYFGNSKSCDGAGRDTRPSAGREGKEGKREAGHHEEPPGAATGGELREAHCTQSALKNASDSQPLY